MASQTKATTDQSSTSISTDVSEMALEELRVAQAELVSGDTNGKVYLRLSESAVAYVTPRQDARARVSSMLREAILKDGEEE
jgi:hypothetical protein